MIPRQIQPTLQIKVQVYLDFLAYRLGARKLSYTRPVDEVHGQGSEVVKSTRRQEEEEEEEVVVVEERSMEKTSQRRRCGRDVPCDHMKDSVRPKTPRVGTHPLCLITQSKHRPHSKRGLGRNMFYLKKLSRVSCSERREE